MIAVPSAAIAAIVAAALAAAGCGGGGGATPTAIGGACLRTPDCAAGARCRGGRCVESVDDGQSGGEGEGEGEAQGGTAGAGADCPAPPPRGVGAPCRRAAECGPGAVCLRNQDHLQFPSGYCSLDVAAAPECCPADSVALRLPGQALLPCLRRCASDADCRAAEGYICAAARGVCLPPPHAECGSPDAEHSRHCEEGGARAEDSARACGDGHDNDADGLIDCDDASCLYYSPCTGQEAEDTDALCRDGRDNDGQGGADCEDPGCRGLPVCPGGPDG